MLIIDFSIFIKVVFSGDTSFLSQRIWQRQIPRTAKVVEMQVVMPCYFTIKQVQSSYCQFHSISMATCLSIYIYIYVILDGTSGTQVVPKEIPGNPQHLNPSILRKTPRHMRMDMRSLMKANLDRKELASETCRFDGTSCWSKRFWIYPASVK